MTKQFGDEERIHKLFSEVTKIGDACKNGDLDHLAYLLQKHPDVLDSPDHDERFTYPHSCLWSPLYLAARHGHEELVKLLLNMGANPVPYEVAAQYHHHTYWDWMTRLHQRGFESIAQMIETALPERYSPLFDNKHIRQAVIKGNIEQVKALISQHPERVQQVDAVGNSLLHLAVASNDLEMTRLLVENGAALDALNGDGRTPGVVALFGLHRYW